MHRQFFFTHWGHVPVGAGSFKNIFKEHYEKF